LQARRPDGGEGITATEPFSRTSGKGKRFGIHILAVILDVIRPAEVTKSRRQRGNHACEKDRITGPWLGVKEKRNAPCREREKKRVPRIFAATGGVVVKDGKKLPLEQEKRSKKRLELVQKRGSSQKEKESVHQSRPRAIL